MGENCSLMISNKMTFILLVKFYSVELNFSSINLFISAQYLAFVRCSMLLTFWNLFNPGNKIRLSHLFSLDQIVSGVLHQLNVKVMQKTTALLPTSLPTQVHAVSA